MDTIESIVKKRLIELKMSNAELAEKAGLSSYTALSKIYARNSAKRETLEKIANVLKLPLIVFYPDSIYNDVKVYSKEMKYIELPHISAKARATFVNSLNEDIPVVWDTYSVLVTDENEDMSDQIVFTIDGDSMEPFYTPGMLVRAKKVPANDWVYISNGVFIVHYAKAFLVVKRIKTNDLQASKFLRLHSDNEATGGYTDVAGNDIQNIWRIVWIVGSPPR